MIGSGGRDGKPRPVGAGAWGVIAILRAMEEPNAGPGTSAIPPQKPAHAREFTWRAVIAGLLVAAVIGASYPYIVLKLGFGSAAELAGHVLAAGAWTAGGTRPRQVTPQSSERAARSCARPSGISSAAIEE